MKFRFNKAVFLAVFFFLMLAAGYLQYLFYQL